MNQQWLDFLTDQGATLVDSHIQFDNQPGDCQISALTHLGYIRVEGKDAETFLQGQLTNDITKVSNNAAQYSAYCSPKGRMYALFTIIKVDGIITLQVPKERIDFLLQRLRMFMMMSQVTLTDVTDEIVSVGITGDCLDAIIPADQQPEASRHASKVFGNTTLLRTSDDSNRLQCIGAVQDTISLWNTAKDQAVPSDTGQWILGEIAAGNPTVYEQTAEAFVPQMANLEIINGISFNKGCFTGQEVVARMQYRGKTKRRMYRVSVTTDTSPNIGDVLYSPDSKTGQWDGKVVERVKTTDNQYDMLIIANIAAIKESSLHLDSTEGPVVTPVALPYSLDAAE